MRPFYDEGGIAIFHGDCNEVLPELRRRGLPLVDMVMADPPYGDTELAWDVRDHRWIDLVADLLRPTGSLWCFGSLRAFMALALVIESRWKIAQEVVWEKHNGSGFAIDRFRRVHELVLQLYPRASRWADVWKEPVKSFDAIEVRVQTRRKKRSAHFGRVVSEPYQSQDGGPRLQRSVIAAPSCHGAAVHPTQKPIAVLSPLIRYSCPPGGVVLDPTMGSGSTLLAASVLGRRAIGIEKNLVDCENAVHRLRGVDVLSARRLALPDPRQKRLFE